MMMRTTSLESWVLALRDCCLVESLYAAAPARSSWPSSRFVDDQNGLAETVAAAVALEVVAGAAVELDHVGAGEGAGRSDAGKKTDCSCVRDCCAPSAIHVGQPAADCLPLCWVMSRPGSHPDVLCRDFWLHQVEPSFPLDVGANRAHFGAHIIVACCCYCLWSCSLSSY